MRETNIDDDTVSKNIFEPGDVLYLERLGCDDILDRDTDVEMVHLDARPEKYIEHIGRLSGYYVSNREAYRICATGSMAITVGEAVRHLRGRPFTYSFLKNTDV